MKKSIIAIALLFASFSAYASCYSEGIRKGDVQKFSAKGVINKSWEGEMVQEGIRVNVASKGGLTNIWKFSVTDPAVAKKMDDAIFAGGSVTVKYCQSLIRNPLMSNTSYEVIDVAPVRK